MRTQRQNSRLFSAWLQRIGATDRPKVAASGSQQPEAAANSEEALRVTLRQFKITVEETRGLPVVRVAGHVENESLVALERVLRGLIQQGHRQVVLDCSRLTYLNSAGMRRLLICQQEMQQDGGDLKWVGLRDDVLRTLLLLQGGTHRWAFRTCDDAVAAIQGTIANGRAG